MKILKLLLLGFLIMNYPEIQKLTDLNKIKFYDWGLKVGRNIEAESKIIEILAEMTPESYLKEVSDTTAFLLNRTKHSNPRIQSALNDLFRNATVLEQNNLQNKIFKGFKGIGVVAFKEVGRALMKGVGFYYGIKGIEYVLAQK